MFIKFALLIFYVYKIHDVIALEYIYYKKYARVITLTTKNPFIPATNATAIGLINADGGVRNDKMAHIIVL